MKKVFSFQVLILLVVQSSLAQGVSQATGKHEFVDLGLSVKWATCNVGAEKPEECGNYYAWAETNTKSTYNISTYSYSKGTIRSHTKYCNDSAYGADGFTDNKVVLDAADDIAHTEWGMIGACLQMKSSWS